MAHRPCRRRPGTAGRRASEGRRDIALLRRYAADPERRRGCLAGGRRPRHRGADLPTRPVRPLLHQRPCRAAGRHCPCAMAPGSSATRTSPGSTSIPTHSFASAAVRISDLGSAQRPPAPAGRPSQDRLPAGPPRHQHPAAMRDPTRADPGPAGLDRATPGRGRALHRAWRLQPLDERARPGAWPPCKPPPPWPAPPRVMTAPAGVGSTSSTTSSPATPRARMAGAAIAAGPRLPGRPGDEGASFGPLPGLRPLPSSWADADKVPAIAKKEHRHGIDRARNGGDGRFRRSDRAPGWSRRDTA